MWETFVRNFAVAMSTREVAEDSLEDTLYGADIGGGAWLDERHAGAFDHNGVWQDGNLVHPNDATVAQARAHTRRVKHLFGYLYRHVADLRLQDMMFLQAQSDGRAAYLVLDQACRRDITDLELPRLNQDFDNSSIEGDVGVTCDSITLFGCHLNGVNARRPEGMRKDEMRFETLHDDPELGI